MIYVRSSFAGSVDDYRVFMHTGRVIMYWGHDMCEPCKEYNVMILLWRGGGLLLGSLCLVVRGSCSWVGWLCLVWYVRRCGDLCEGGCR